MSELNRFRNCVFKFLSMPKLSAPHQHNYAYFPLILQETDEVAAIQVSSMSVSITFLRHSLADLLCAILLIRRREFS